MGSKKRVCKFLTGGPGARNRGLLTRGGQGQEVSHVSYLIWWGRKQNDSRGAKPRKKKTGHPTTKFQKGLNSGPR